MMSLQRGSAIGRQCVFQRIQRQQHSSQHCRRARRLGCRVSAESGQTMAFHIGETTVSFPFNRDQAQKLSGSVKGLLETFAEKQKAERPKRWSMMEYKLKGDPDAKALRSLEVYCNPNAYSTAFDAKVLITLATAEGVKVTTEGRLSALKSDVDTFLETAS